MFSHWLGKYGGCCAGHGRCWAVCPGERSIGDQECGCMSRLDSWPHPAHSTQSSQSHLLTHGLPIRKSPKSQKRKRSCEIFHERTLRSSNQVHGVALATLAAVSIHIPSSSHPGLGKRHSPPSTFTCLTLPPHPGLPSWHPRPPCRLD